MYFKGGMPVIHVDVLCRALFSSALFSGCTCLFQCRLKQDEVSIQLSGTFHGAGEKERIQLSKDLPVELN